MHVQVVKGTAKEIGKALGCFHKDRLEPMIDELLHKAKERFGLDEQRLMSGAMPWFNTLNQTYQDTLIAMAESSSVSLDKIIWSYYFDRVMGCSGFITTCEDHLYIGRNNDFIALSVPEWITVIHQDQKNPLALIGLPGSIFAGTGFNASKLWMHYHFLPTKQYKTGISPFIFIREALETCNTISDVEQRLKNTTLDGNMFLYVANGQDNTAAGFECCDGVIHQVNFKEHPIYTTNHGLVLQTTQTASSIQRYHALERLLQTQHSVKSLKEILLHEHVVQRGISETTFSAVINITHQKLSITDRPLVKKPLWVTHDLQSLFNL